MTSWQVLVLYPLFAFRVKLVLSSLAEDRLPPSSLLFSYRFNHCSAIHYIGPAAAGVRARGFGPMCMGRPGPKTVVLISRMAQFDHAGCSKRACRFALSSSPSRAFRRYNIMANRAGGSKVRASTPQAGPLEPPFRKAQMVSSVDILRVRSYQR